MLGKGFYVEIGVVSDKFGPHSVNIELGWSRSESHSLLEVYVSICSNKLC